jgi:DNA-binding NtrC family response regulator
MTIRKPAHLLLVDDDPGLLKLLGMRLTSEGYSVVTAESGRRRCVFWRATKSNWWSAIYAWMRWTACSCSAKSRKFIRGCR